MDTLVSVVVVACYDDGRKQGLLVGWVVVIAITQTRLVNYGVGCLIQEKWAR
jgi:hypothetical protein